MGNTAVAPRFCLPAANPQSAAQREKLFLQSRAFNQ